MSPGLKAAIAEYRAAKAAWHELAAVKYRNRESGQHAAASAMADECLTLALKVQSLKTAAQYLFARDVLDAEP